MKRFSIKQLVIILIVGAVLLNGAQYFTMRSLGYDQMNHEEMLDLMVENGRITEEEKQEMLDNGLHHGGNHRKGFNKDKFR